MKTATVIWADGRVMTFAVVAETAHTFTTDDVNRCRWWKRNGLRVGSSQRHVRKAFITWAVATARLENVPGRPLIDVLAGDADANP